MPGAGTWGLLLHIAQPGSATGAEALLAGRLASGRHGLSSLAWRVGLQGGRAKSGEPTFTRRRGRKNHYATFQLCGGPKSQSRSPTLADGEGMARALRCPPRRGASGPQPDLLGPRPGAAAPRPPRLPSLLHGTWSEWISRGRVRGHHVSCFLSQLLGRQAQRGSNAAAFREHSPSRPSRPSALPGSSSTPLRKDSELQKPVHANRRVLPLGLCPGGPATSQCHPPGAAGRHSLWSAAEEARRERVCLWGCCGTVCARRAAENPAWSACSPPPGVAPAAGLRRDLRAGAHGRAPAPREPRAAHWATALQVARTAGASASPGPAASCEVSLTRLFRTLNVSEGLRFRVSGGSFLKV